MFYSIIAMRRVRTVKGTDNQLYTAYRLQTSIRGVVECQPRCLGAAFSAALACALAACSLQSLSCSAFARCSGWPALSGSVKFSSTSFIWSIFWHILARCHCSVHRARQLGSKLLETEIYPSSQLFSRTLPCSARNTEANWEPFHCYKYSDSRI
jgi:hypothetical protein